MKEKLRLKKAGSFCLRLLLVAVLMQSSLFVFAQNILSKGNVTDETGEAVIGASVVIKNTSTGTITDLDGNFELNVEQGQTLVISYVGMVTQEVVVRSNSKLKIVLKNDSKVMEEVVVVGYGSMRRKDVTTSVAIVSTEDINQRPLVSTASAIQGKAAGVQVIQPNGEPGAGMQIRIRGNTSINASNDPLYVVDGVPMDEVTALVPTDIESMTILKDASSAAIYGSRAANGVVLITTKRGQSGEAKIGFNSFLGVSKIAKRIESLNTSQYKDLMDDIGLIKLPNGLTDQTDWFDEVFQTGINQNYQLSISSGNDKMRYFVSGGYTRDQGVIKTAFFERYNFRANLENQVRKWLKFSTNLSYADYSSNGIISGQDAGRGGVILSIINTPRYGKIWSDEHPNQYYTNFYGANLTHPVENRDRTADDRKNNNRFIGSGIAEITFTPELKFKHLLTIDRVYHHETTWLDPIAGAYGRSVQGRASDKKSLSTILTFDNLLSYDKSFGLHNLSLMGGTSLTTSDWNESTQASTQFLSSEIKTVNAGNKLDQSSKTIASQWAIMSYLARAAYNYESKYLLTLNMRADGSSKLSPEHRWGYFPSMSAGWRMSSENFMKELTFIDDMKVRSGWGKTGNQSGISDYSYLERNNINRQDWWQTGKDDAKVIPTVSSIRNKDLTWETTTQTNVGLDITVFKNRLTFTADAYYKYTTDLLMNVELPSHLAVTNIYRNEGEMANKGIEFAISSRNLTGAFSWDTEFNISFNRNELKKLTLSKVYYYAEASAKSPEKIVRITEGQPIGKFWGYVSEGVDPETGDIIYADLDGSGTLNTADKTYIGDPNPDFTFGLTNNFSFKNFNLNFFFTGAVGNDVYNASRIETEGMYGAGNQTTSVLNRWRIPGQITDMPRAVEGTDNLRASSRWVEDGSYLRLRALTFAYNASPKFLKKWGINKLQPYITAENLLTFTNYKGFDPEVNQFGTSAVMQGIDWGTYPQTKTFIFGLNLEF